MRVHLPTVGLAALLGAAPTALAHPGADAHLHATQSDRCEPHTQTRRVASLIDEDRLADARRELESGRHCPRTTSGMAVAEADLLRLEGHPAQALPLLDAVLEREPSHAGAHTSRARALVALSRPEEAADHWLAVARAHENAVEPWLQAADLDARRAAPILEEALERLGPLPTLTLAAAEARLTTQPTRGLELLASHPPTVDAWLLRARLHQAMGDLAARDLDRFEAHRAALAMRPSPKRTELLALLSHEATP